MGAVDRSRIGCATQLRGSLRIDSAADLRRAGPRAHCAEPESPEGKVEEVPEHQTYQQGQEESGVKPAITQQRKAS